MIVHDLGTTFSVISQMSTTMHVFMFEFLIKKIAVQCGAIVPWYYEYLCIGIDILIPSLQKLL